MVRSLLILALVGGGSPSVLRPDPEASATGRTVWSGPHRLVPDSAVGPVTFTATGGTVSSAGLYTAGGSGGSYRVTATLGPLADTAVVTLASPTKVVDLSATTAPVVKGPTVPPKGIPFGFYRMLLKSPDPGVLTLSSENNSPGNIVSRIEFARERGVRLMLAMTGGNHRLYMSSVGGVYKFDRSLWEARLQSFHTVEIQHAVAQGVADGTIIGATVMDEPYVSGGADGGGNTWGPKGTMTKTLVDSLCADVQALFPSLPAGVEHQHQLFEPDKSYRVCQFIVDQYGSQYGEVTAWRDAALAMAKRDGHAILFSLNVLDGGVQDKSGGFTCSGPGQAGRGTHRPNCRMTPDQIVQYGTALGPYGCGLFMWRYDEDFATQPANVVAFKDVAARLAAAPARACRRS